MLTNSFATRDWLSALVIATMIITGMGPRAFAQTPSTDAGIEAPSLDQSAAPPAPTGTTTPDVPEAALHANLLSNPTDTHDSATAAAPVIQWLLANGATVTPLGSAGGLAGWLISENGAQQTVYVTPDGAHLVAGLLASDKGEDITALQLTALTLGHAPVITKEDPSGRGTPPNSVAPPAAASDPPAPVTTSPSAPSSPASVPTAMSLPKNTNPAAAAVGAMAMAQPDAHELAITPVQLGQAINHTAIFTLGAVGKPDLIMLADPNCPYCHASWNLLGPLVQAGKIDVTVMLVSVLKGSDTKVVDLLANPKIGEAWEAGQGSEDGVPVTPPGPRANLTDARYLMNANDAFKTAIKLTGTPTLFWVSRADSHSPYRVYRGTGLAGVGGFLSDVENHQVATIK